MARAPWERTRRPTSWSSSARRAPARCATGLPARLAIPGSRSRTGSRRWLGRRRRAGRWLPRQGPRVTEIRRDGEVVAAIVHDAAVLDDPALVEAVGARRAARGGQRAAPGRAARAARRGRRLARPAPGARRRGTAPSRGAAARACGAPAGGARGPARRRAGLARPHAARRPRWPTSGSSPPGSIRGSSPSRAWRPRCARWPTPRRCRSTWRPPRRRSRRRRRSPCTSPVPRRLPTSPKYACATRVGRAGGGGRRARLEVADDGEGGADPARGSGLRGLADRLAALGGRLEVDSPPGAGTRLVAVLPLSGDGIVLTGGPTAATARSPDVLVALVHREHGAMSSVPSRSRTKLNVSTLSARPVEHQPVAADRRTSRGLRPRRRAASGRRAASSSHLAVAVLRILGRARALGSLAREPPAVRPVKDLGRARGGRCLDGSEQEAGTSTGGAGGSCALSARMAVIASRVPGSRCIWE